MHVLNTMESYPSGRTASESAHLNHSQQTSTAAEQLADIVGRKMSGECLLDLKGLIPANQSRTFIKKLFDKNTSQYEEFLTLLNCVLTWKHAAALIDGYFSRTGVDCYSKEALEFSDIVYRRYFPKDTFSLERID